MPEEEAPVNTMDTADLVVPCYLLMLDVLLKQARRKLHRHAYTMGRWAERSQNM